MIEEGFTKKVLDHGHIKLIECMGRDERVVEAARQSTGKGFISWAPYTLCNSCELAWDETATIYLSDEDGVFAPSKDPNCKHESTMKYPQGDMGLLDNLMRNRHTTPFEMGGEIIFEVKAPIMVFREWHRHRTQSYNEMSARYVQMPNEHYLPDASRIQKQSTSNKQGSAEAWDEEIAMKVISGLGSQQQMIYDSYDEWVEQGLAKEVARLNTPVARYSQMWAKTDLLNWLKFLTLRMRPAAQFEIRQYANIVADVIKDRWPRVWWLFEEYDLFAVRFSRTEMNVLRRMMFNFTDANDEKALRQEIESFLTGTDSISNQTKRKEFLLKLEKGGVEMLANP
jgi:thymidylate synthase (FAD)